MREQTPFHRAAEPAPVASLEPRETKELWRRLVASPPPSAQQQADCRPLRGVFYAATDFLRLATKLAATPSPCAEYYISVPPLVSDKTLPRPNAAPRIRALGPNFHAMAEIHFATWTRWVASTGSSWHAAGVTARARMAAAGFDVAQGDTWVFNELTTAVRRGTGNARANVREFLRGLYEGDGSRPTRGAVFVIGFGQRSSDVSLYQTNLQNWLADSAFWTDMNTYVSDWTQEAYGDVRSWAVPGAPTSVRRDSLNDYLQHKLVLAGAGPPEIETARAYLRATYSPLANAAWERDTGYGWTMVSAQQMAGVRLRAGSRPPLLQRDERAVARPLGIRVGAEERSRASRRPTSPRRRVSSSTGSRRRCGTPRRRPILPIREARPAGRRARTSGASATSRARACPRHGSRSGAGRSRCWRSRRRRRRSPPGRPRRR